MKRTAEGTVICSSIWSDGFASANIDIGISPSTPLAKGAKVHLEWDEPVPYHECDGLKRSSEYIEYSEVGGVWKLCYRNWFLDHVEYCPECGKKMEV